MVIISNLQPIPFQRENEEVRQPRNNPGLIAGKKVYVLSDAKSAWISRIVCALIVAAGIALIAAIATTGAIAGGVTLIVLGLGGLLLTEAYRADRMDKTQRIMKKHLSETLHFREDYRNVPEIGWTEDKKNVNVRLTQRQIDAYPLIEFQRPSKIFVANCDNKQNHPFVIIVKPDDNQHEVSAIVYDSKMKKKSFHFELNGETIKLNEAPQTIQRTRNQ